MHRDICQEVQLVPADTRPRQQRALDKWRQQFNHVRPQQALNGKTPAEVYKSTAKAEEPLAENESLKTGSTSNATETLAGLAWAAVKLG